MLSRFPRDWVAAFWFLAFALCFLVRSAYGYGAALIALAGIAAAVVDLRRPHPPLPLPTRRWLGMLLLYFSVMLLCYLVLQQNLREYDKLSRYLYALPLTYALWRFHPSPKTYAAALCAAAVAGFCVVFNARIVQGLPVGAGYGYQHHIQFSNILMIFALAAAFAAFAYPRGSRWWLALHLAALCGIVGAFLGGGRGSWLMLVPGALLYGAALPNKHPWRNAAIALLLLAAAVTLLYALPQTGVAERIARLWQDLHAFAHGNSASSQGMRLEMWRCAVPLFAENPVWGWGTPGIEEGLRQLSAENICFSGLAKFNFNHLHNDFIDNLTRYGIIGQTVFLLFYFYPAVHYLQRLRQADDASARSNALGGLAVCAAYYTASLSNAFLTHNIGIIFFLLFNSYFMTAADGEHFRPTGKSKIKRG